MMTLGIDNTEILKKILILVINETRVTFEEIMANMQYQEICDAKALFCYLAVYSTEKRTKQSNWISYKEIANFIGYKDHGTVCFNVKKWQNLVDTDIKTKRMTSLLRIKVKEEIIKPYFEKIRNIAKEHNWIIFE